MQTRSATVWRSAATGELAPCITTANIGVSAVIICALAVIVGYGIHAESLIRLKPGLSGMALLTAIALAALGGALVLQCRGFQATARGVAWAAVALGLVILILQAAFGADLLSVWVDAVLGYGIGAAPQVSIATALCICALGFVILLQAHAVATDSIALGLALVSGFALLGYAYDVDELYALPIFKSMALHTAASLLVLSMASILLRRDSNWCRVIGARTEAGAATRRQLVFLTIPVMAGAGLVRAITAGIIGPAAALALLVAVTVASLVLLILRDGRRLVDIEVERRAKWSVAETLNAEMSHRLKLQEIENVRRNAEQAQAQSTLFRAQRLEALSRLTGSIAHEFNNLLQAIGGTLDILARRGGDGNSVAPLVERAKAAVRRGAKLGSQLLAFSRTQKLDLRPHKLDDLIIQSQAIVAAALGTRVEMRYEFQSLEQWITTDADQFSLALLNLALNARDAMHGRGTFTMKTSLQASEPTTAENPSFVSIQVCDTGEGMSAEVLSRATEPFFSTKPEGTASGLGLAQVQSLMRQCQGDLRLKSEVGIGTTVAMLFPAQISSAVSAKNRDENPSREASAQPLILVIEDDEAVRRVIVDGLGDLGYQVAEAQDGALGLELLKTLRPTAAVIDYLMPLMNGAEVAQRARADTPDLPIVFISGHFETAALQDFTNATILRKPFELTDLRASLSAVLR